MSSDDDDDIFGDDGNDSDDTADLFQQAGAQKKAAAPKKKAAPAPPKKKKKDEGDDLFDSDSDDDDEQAGADSSKKPKAAKPKPKAMSKKEKMEALAKKKRQDGAPPRAKESSKKSSKNKDKGDGAAGEEGKEGYESDASVDSAQIERNEDDNNFIDTTGEDAEAIKEYYAEQHFDAEEEDMEDDGDGGKKKRKYRDDEAMEDGKEPDNPIEAAIYRLKRKKRESKSFNELDSDAKDFVGRMEVAAEQDEESIAARRPGTKKLQMLNEVLTMMKKQDYQNHLIDSDLLAVVRRWVQPLANGQLGNVTLRQKLLEAVANFPSIDRTDLKNSGLGKTVMLLHKHPKETPAMKRQTRNLIEQWSRGIFGNSGNMEELSKVQHSRGEGSLAAFRARQAGAAGVNVAARRDKPGDLKSIISSGKRGGEATAASANRVRVPFSKGFAFSVRPTRDPAEAQPQRSPAKEARGGLAKRMIEKSRKVGKNQRSANISIEGRRTKP